MIEDGLQFYLKKVEQSDHMKTSGLNLTSDMDKAFYTCK